MSVRRTGPSAGRTDGPRRDGPLSGVPAATRGIAPLELCVTALGRAVGTVYALHSGVARQYCGAVTRHQRLERRCATECRVILVQLGVQPVGVTLVGPGEPYAGF